MAKSKDLFDDSTMTFGEHLDVLRTHLIRSILWLICGVIIALIFGTYLVAFVRMPIDNALQKYGVTGTDDLQFNMTEWIKGKLNGSEETEYERKRREHEEAQQAQKKRWDSLDDDEVLARIKASDAHTAFKKAGFQMVEDEAPLEDSDVTIILPIRAREFEQLKRAVEEIDKPKTFNVQEAFMIYLKVSLVFGFVLASPMIFREMWLFVAAGLYPHERRYVHIYLPLSLGLFVGGALFCFFAVFPFVLKFLLGFNSFLEVQPQIRLSEWISFAIMLPLMFGLSFQLPIVMLFLERISVFDSETYRNNRRMAYLVITFVSMMLTPADPTSMLLMMFPLGLLYELGIKLTAIKPASASPFEEQPA